MSLLRSPISAFRFWAAAGMTFLVAIALIATVPTAQAQSSSATLSGTVLDATGAIVPGATITLKNQASGDTRTAVSNGDGFFNFAAIPPGTYTVRIARQGFAAWQASGIVLSSGDNRSVRGISLKVGQTNQTIYVNGTTTQITPTDSGDKSFTIDQKIMQNVAIVGQNAAEFIKIMPGMAMTGNGGLNRASYQADNEGTGNGPVQDFSPNGQRTGALNITSDGANIIDPGCNCGQAENTNTEMTSEVKVMMSNFGADSAKGPVVINTVGKSGGHDFHGEAYLYSRYYLFNANDWLGNHAGVNAATGEQIAPRPQTKYFFPGFQIGGPVLIPKTNFNHNRDKLFFFFGVEYYKQNVDNGIYSAAVPTKAMRAGDFSDASYIASLAGSSITNVPINGGPNGNGFTCTQWATQPDGSQKCVASMVTPGAIDPSGQAMMNVYPMPNADPVANGGNNYISAQTRFANMIQYRARVDYSINDSTKLFVEYNHQNDNAEESLDTLWTGNAQSWDDPTTPYPTPIIESSDSEVVTANMTKVFTPTLTNEVIFNWVYLNLPNKFQDPSKVERGSLGINYNMLFNHGDNSKIIYPELTGWGDGISNQLNAGFELNGTVYAKKTLPSVADNITKVWKTHTSKFGFYWERTWNSQPGNSPVNGLAVFSNWGSSTSGNAYADMLLGQTTQYSEQNFNVVPAFRYLSTEFYGMDEWKASRRLTLDYGIRVSHLGPWVDTTGYGFAAWYPSLYGQGVGGSVEGATFPGIEWHKVHGATPLSGSASRLFFYNPRVGFAWDIFGSGKTLLRGGYGIYHFHDEQNVQNGAYGIVRGSFSSPTLWSPAFSQLGPQTGPLAVPSAVQVLDPTDDKQPQTQDWSLTVAQRAPWNSLVEVAYVGNKSDYLSNYNNNFDQLNDLNVGSLFNKYGWLPDCDPTVAINDSKLAPSNCESPGTGADGTVYDNSFSSSETQNARPLQAYGTLKMIDHKMYSNYNSLQVTWNKQAGRFTFLTNYTFSKALGVRGESGSATGDPTSLKNNYGTLPNNRTNLFNVAYVYQFPNLTSVSNRFVRQVTDGWQISGITQYSTGADLQAAITSNFSYTAYIPAGTTFMGKTTALPIQAGNQNALGTADVSLMPKLTCDPRHGLHSNQYVNGNCFANFVTPGQQGNYIFPTMTGPGFFNSDLSVFKNFVFGNSEDKKIQFRFSGYNFLNRANRTFNTNNDGGLKLNFDQNGNQVPQGGVPFGYATSKIGHRIMQGEVKFSW